MPSENHAFTTRVDPVSPPTTPVNESGVWLVEAPGTAPGSTTLIPQGVYRHSRRTDDANIGTPVRQGKGVCDIIAECVAVTRGIRSFTVPDSHAV